MERIGDGERAQILLSFQSQTPELSIFDRLGRGGWLAAAVGGRQRHCPALAFTSEKEIPLSISMSKRREEMRSCQEGEDHECLVVMAGMSEKGFALIDVFEI